MCFNIQFNPTDHYDMCLYNQVTGGDSAYTFYNEHQKGEIYTNGPDTDLIVLLPAQSVSSNPRIFFHIFRKSNISKPHTSWRGNYPKDPKLHGSYIIGESMSEVNTLSKSLHRGSNS